MKKITIFVLTALLMAPLNAYSVEFTLFGDVVYSITSAEETSDTFQLGEFDLFANQEIGKDTFVTAELVFEDPGHGFEADVERFSVTRTMHSLFSIGMGRFHNHLGIWSQNFHHGSLIQDTITRPFFLEFEDSHGGIFPNHIVGIQFSGESEMWSYQLSYANSNGIDTTGAESHSGDSTLEVINAHDPSNEKSFVARIAVKPNFLVSEVGFFYMSNNVLELGQEDEGEDHFLDYGETLFDQQIAGFDLRYTGEKFYTFFELFYMIIDDNQNINANTPVPAPPATLITPNSESYSALAYYLQMGFHITETLSLVGRYESLDYDANATYYELLDIPRENRVVLALNYKIQESNSLRLEFNTANPEGEDTTNTLAMQWFFILF